MKFPSLSRVKSIAVVGANGLVGREFLELLSEFQVPIPRVKRLAPGDSWESAGEGEDSEELEPLEAGSFDDVEAVFFASQPGITRKFLPYAKKAGCIVVDDSGAYQTLEGVPVVVPEVNGSLLRDFSGSVIANPRVGTVPLSLVLKPLVEKFGVARAVISTYQSVSEVGMKGYEELSFQSAQMLNGAEPEGELFPHPIAFNCIPLVGKAGPEGESDEESNLTSELRRVLGLDDLKLHVSAVRVPTFCGYGATVSIELKQGFGDIREVRELLDQAAGLRVLDNPGADIYPTNRECTGSDLTFVGRLRRDASVASGVSLWVMTDNLRKGAALNALECLETLYRYRRMA